MVPIRWSRVIAGGLLAGVIVNAGEYLVNGVLLAAEWADAMLALNRPTEFTGAQLLSFNIWGFLIGIAAVWLYAVLRDRYAPGPGTAFRAGLAMWAVVYLIPAIPSSAMQFFPFRMTVYGALGGLVEIAIGTLVGAWVYRPAEAGRRTAA